MKKRKLLIVGVLGVIVFCLGYTLHQHNKKEQYRLSINESQTNIKKIEKELDSFYLSKERDFLKQAIDGNQFNKIEEKISKIVISKANTVDSNLHKMRKKIESDKTKLYKKYERISIQMSIQEKTNSLFESPVLNGDSLVDEDNQIICETTNQASINEIDMKLITNSYNNKWGEVIQSLIKTAQEQFDYNTKLQQRINDYFLNGEVNSTVTREDYDSLSKAIDLIRNPSLKNEMNKKLEQIEQKLVSIEEEAKIKINSWDEAKEYAIEHSDIILDPNAKLLEIFQSDNETYREKMKQRVVDETGSYFTVGLKHDKPRPIEKGGFGITACRVYTNGRIDVQTTPTGVSFMTVLNPDN